MKKATGIIVTLILIGTVLLSTGNSPFGNLGGIVQAYTAPPPVAWLKHYGNDWIDEKAYSVIQTSDGGYVLAGSIYYASGQTDALLVKTDSDGNHQWNMTYGGNGFDIARSIVQTSDGGYVFAGYTSSYTSNIPADYDVWLVKTDSAGNQLWSKTFSGANGYDYAYSMVQTSDGGYAIAGQTMALGAGNGDAWLVKTYANGGYSWSKTYGGPNEDCAYSMVQTTDGGFALAGAGIDLIKTDSTGNMQWSRTLNFKAVSVVQTSDGGYAVAGDGGGGGLVGYDFHLIKTDSNGYWQWNQSYTQPYEEYLQSLIQTSDGGYALAGTTFSIGHTPLNGDFYLVKTDSQGVEEWHQFAGGYYADAAYCVIRTSDGGYAMAGYGYNIDFELVKISAPEPPPQTYSATIWSWDIDGWLSEPIIMDGISTGFSTGHTFTGLTGTHTFTLPSIDSRGYPFSKWFTGETSTTLTVTSEGTYTAQYGLTVPAYLVVRGNDNSIYYRNYNLNWQVWSSWATLPSGSTGDTPAAAVIGNELHIVVRGVNYGQIWHGYVNLDDNVFSGWTLLSGATPSAPTLSANSTHLYLVVRGNDNNIYYRLYTIASRSWSTWSTTPPGSTGDSIAAELINNELHIVVRGMSGGVLWHSYVNLASSVWSGWNALDGSSPSAPTLTSNSTHLALAVRGNNNLIYYRLFNLAARTWNSWASLPSGSTGDAVAATIAGGKLFAGGLLTFVVRGSSGGVLWHGQINTESNYFSGWSALDGSSPSTPTLTS